MEAKQIDPKYHVEILPTIHKVGDFDVFIPGTKVEIVNAKGEPVPVDEPMFLIRGRDHLAVFALKKYRDLAEADGCTDFHLNGIDERIVAFERFAEQHPERMKQPGVTRGL